MAAAAATRASLGKAIVASLEATEAAGVAAEAALQVLTDTVDANEAVIAAGAAAEATRDARAAVEIVANTARSSGVSVPLDAVVEINLPQKVIPLSDVKTLEKAVCRLMEACGFESQEQGSVTTGSWFKRVRFWSKETLSSPQAQEALRTGQEALHRKVIDQQGGDIDAKLAAAASSVIEALQPFDSGVIRLSEILVIKITRNAKSHLLVQKMSSGLSRQLESNPLILRDPDKVLAFLEERSAPVLCGLDDKSEGATQAPSERP